MGRTKFWEEPLNVMDTLRRRPPQQLRRHRSRRAPDARPSAGLVAFTSSSGGVHYAFGPAYGVPKAGTDKMAADMGLDFKDAGIAAVSVWMGTLLTDRVRTIIAGNSKKFGYLLDSAETPELTGHVVWALFNDPDLMDVSGRTLIGAELAAKFGITDEAGRQPPSYRELFGVHPTSSLATPCGSAWPKWGRALSAMPRHLSRRWRAWSPSHAPSTCGTGGRCRCQCPIPGIVVNTSSSAMRPSSRASGAPKTEVRTTPNVRCPAAFRWMSKRSGSSKWRSSRLADASMSSSALPLGTGCP